MEGVIQLNWPGKNDNIVFDGDRWHLIPFASTRNKHALLFNQRIGGGENRVGMAIIGDELSCLEALRPFISSEAKFVYYDAPRLSVFPGKAESGYAVSTWLSLIKHLSERVKPCLKREGFLAIHTDEQLSHYARMILDETFGKDNYVGTFAWQKQYAPQNDLNIPTDVFDYIVVYSKAPAEELPKIGLLVTPDDLKDDGDFRGCYIDGHKGARSGSEATKFHVNTSPYHWRIVESRLPSGRYHFDSILGVLWFESVNECGQFSITVEATDRVGHTATKTICFEVREPQSLDDVFELPTRIWWLLKNDNDIQQGGDLVVSDFRAQEVYAIKGQQFSLVFKATGGEVFSMRSDSPGTNRYWEFGLRTLVQGIAQAKASFGNTGSALPSIKKFFDRSDAKKRASVMNFLPWYDFGHTQDATQHSKALMKAQITNGGVNMMAKPQRLLGHLISLFAPEANDLVLSIGDVNGVFASVAAKLNRFFIHLSGGFSDDITEWVGIGSKRIRATIEGKDDVSLEGSDTLESAAPVDGFLDVLSLSKSYLVINEKTNDIEPHLSDDESVADFWAGLAGAYRSSKNDEAFFGINKRTVVIVPETRPLDTILIEQFRKKYPKGKLLIVYESKEGELTLPLGVSIKRAPFELI